MPEPWMPGAVKVYSVINGGSMVGGKPRAVEHTYEAPYDLSSRQGMESLIRSTNVPHFVFHPISGEVVQALPATVAARALKNASGGVQTNRMGSVCIQTEVIGYARRPWTLDLTDAGRAGLAKLNAWRRSWGIPDVWPAGGPPAFYENPFRNAPESPRSSTIWTTKGGYFGHSQVPENDHGDPGALDIGTFFGDDDMAISVADADLIIDRLLTTLLGSSGPVVSVALQDGYRNGRDSLAILRTLGKVPEIDYARLAEEVVSRLPSTTLTRDDIVSALQGVRITTN